MESRTRNTFVLLTVVFALQCVSAEFTSVVNPAAKPAANPAAKPAANPAPVVLSPSDNIAKTESAPLTNNVSVSKRNDFGNENKYPKQDRLSFLL